jgi:2-octaprenyl-6-methoxyphenol hydroxylase
MTLALSQHQNIRWLCPAQACTKKFQNGMWHINCVYSEQNVSIQASILVGADGTESWVRATEGIGVQRYDYQQTAILTTLAYEGRAVPGLAYEHFLKGGGALALLPLTGNTMKCIWTVPTEDATWWLQRSTSGFLSALTYQLGDAIPQFTDILFRAAYPLHRVLAESVYSDQWVLLGNAAQTVHPIAAQGLNLGLRDIETVIPYLNPLNFSEYARARQKNRDFIAQITHYLAREGGLQSVGILACEYLPYVKSWSLACMI